VPKSGEVGALPDDGGGSDSATSDTDNRPAETDFDSESGGTGEAPPVACDPEDQDGDGVPFAEDNADQHFNPTQADQDGDGIADVVDLCPLLGGDPNNSADSDRDGVGNDCDSCRQAASQYNDGAGAAGVPVYMQVRNIPDQHDTDHDGIGDACDNCVWGPNCDGYDLDNPYRLGDPIPYDQDDRCQQDTDADFIGDDCATAGTRPDAGGPIGFGEADDFDQDGITNVLDKCPRQPIAEAEMIACSGGGDCPEGRSCDDGWCNHLDVDGDAVGDACDTCPFSPNPNQELEGGAQEDDEDGDFVGVSCETAPACATRGDPRQLGFFEVQADGNCCTVQLVVSQATGDLLDARTCDSGQPPSAATCQAVRVVHPDDPSATLPLRTAEDCPEEQVDGEWVCRQLPPTVASAPGILAPPPGCDDALAAAGTTAIDNGLAPLTEADFAGEADPLDALWQQMCFLPQSDQDFDGLGDVCDFCPFAYDPDNTNYIDDSGRLWPNDGAYCNGDFLCD
jgi:hypothetical protein